MNIIDLSGDITSGMWNYGHPNPEVEIKEVANIKNNNFLSSSISMSILSGSYLETGRHLYKNRNYLDEFSLERFISTASVLNFQKNKSEPITKNDLEKYENLILKNRSLLIGTKWDKNWNEDFYISESPYFTEEAVKFIMNLEVTLLGSDIPCYNSSINKNNVLKIYYREKKNLILAPLINIRKIPCEEIKLISLPIKIKNQCAAPCRAVAIVK